MNLSKIHLAAFVVSTFLLLNALPAYAGETPLLRAGDGMESHLFRSAVDTKGHFSVDATPVLPHMAISLGLMLDFGFHSWIAVEQQDDDSRDDKIYNNTMVDTLINATLFFNWGLFDIISIGFGIPIVIPSGQIYEYDMVKQKTGSKGWSSKGYIGDLMIHTKLRWIRADRHAVGLGTVIQYQAPTSKPEYLMGEPGGGVLSGKMILDAEPINWYRFSLNVGARIPFGANEDNYLNDDRVTDNVGGVEVTSNLFEFGPNGENSALNERLLFKYGPMLTFGIGQSFTLWPGVLDFVLEIYGSQLMSEFGNMGYFSSEITGGFKLFVERNSYLMAGYCHGIPISGTPSMYGYQAMEHRMFIGFAFEPSIGDRDGDGLKDDVDQCPDDPEDTDDFEDTDGCPDLDNDRDGIFDVEDDCPLVPEDKDGDQDDDGCPERGTNDRDGDGILDSVDQCPDDPEDLDQFEDENGCPDNDNDQDQIMDVNDICPNEPEDPDGFEDQNGCPDPDNDADRIPDVDDTCPNEPETYNGKDDKDGCPDQGDVVLTGTDIKILKKVYFEYDSAVIKTISYDILDAVAATVINNPQIDLIEIQGHADERGDDDYNLRLTADRAASVVTYLVKKGVKPKKLRSVGYGEYCPVEKASNETAWEKNRRVEFKVLSIDGNSTGVQTACEKAKAKGIGN
jgi:OmpA-OmpF porin, OOP family